MARQHAADYPSGAWEVVILPAITGAAMGLLLSVMVYAYATFLRGFVLWVKGCCDALLHHPDPRVQSEP